MKYILIPVIALLAACSDGSESTPLPPAPAVEQDFQGQSNWADGAEDPPYYSTTQADAADAEAIFRSYSRAERFELCEYFWNYTDDEITDDLLSEGLSLSFVNATLNFLWRNC